MQGGNGTVLKKIRHRGIYIHGRVGIEQALENAIFYLVLSSAIPRHLIVVHYHLRPGGVRRIIETALPAIAAATGKHLKRITLAVGEAGASGWQAALVNSVSPARLEVFVEPAFGYFSEQGLPPKMTRDAIRAALAHLVRPGEAGETLFWFHNPAIGRNAILGEELGRLGAKLGFASILHHHDFWCANRWARWWEMRQCGFRTPAAAARALFVAGARVAHVCINSADHKALRQFFLRHSAHLPNPLKPRFSSTPTAAKKMKLWLKEATGSAGPVWLCPTRILRRKNIAESILITRWLRPEACLATTSGVSSVGEQEYASRLQSAAKAGKWNVRFGLLDGLNHPAVAEVIDASEAIVLTSLQEGFGLGFVEAGAKPLIARALPDIMPDLAALGFQFPYLYDEVFIASDLVDRKSERRRQTKLWKTWKENLPAVWRSRAGHPTFLMLADGEPVPFSQLTLSAQLEVLALPPERTWKACKHLNPCLERWQNAGPELLEKTHFPEGKLHDAQAFAEGWLRIAASISPSPAGLWAASEAQENLAGRALASSSLYPILIG